MADVQFREGEGWAQEKSGSDERVNQGDEHCLTDTVVV